MGNRIDILNNLSDEELLKQLEKAKPVKKDDDIQYLDSIMSFLTEFNITPGKEKVHVQILVELYKLYTKKNITQLAFKREINKYINVKNSYCYLNKKAFTIKSKSLELLEEKAIEKIKTPRKKQHFENFIKRYNLKSGNLKVHIDILYYLYDKWTYEIKKNSPYSKDSFNRLCNLYFETTVTAWETFICVDESITQHISRSKIEETNKKKKDKISKSRSKLKS